MELKDKLVTYMKAFVLNSKDKKQKFNDLIDFIILYFDYNLFINNLDKIKDYLLCGLSEDDKAIWEQTTKLLGQLSKPEFEKLNGKRERITQIIRRRLDFIIEKAFGKKNQRGNN